MQSLCWSSRRKPCFHYGQAVCLTPGHIESAGLPGHPPHVSLSLALPQAFASGGILLRHSIRPGRLLQERHDGFPRSEYPLFVALGWRFTPGLMRAVTMHLGTAWPQTSSLLGLLVSRLAGCASRHFNHAFIHHYPSRLARRDHRLG